MSTHRTCLSRGGWCWRLVLAAVVTVVGGCTTSPVAETVPPTSTVTSTAASSDDTGRETQPSETAAPSTTDAPDEGAESAEAIASEFVARIQASADSSDYGAAADMWSGYPYPEAEKLAHLETFVDHNRWLIDAQVRFDVVDAWSLEPPATVSVVAITDLEWRGTTAILIDQAGTIQRIQTDEDLDAPVTVDGDRIVVPAQPVEGDLVAYLSGEVVDSESVAIDPETGSVIITLADSSEGGDRAVLILSMATPELPTAMSVLLPE